MSSRNRARRKGERELKKGSAMSYVDFRKNSTKFGHPNALAQCGSCDEYLIHCSNWFAKIPKNTKPRHFMLSSDVSDFLQRKISGSVFWFCTCSRRRTQEVVGDK